jgi:hypothetical protein
MKDEGATGSSFLQRPGVTQIAGDALNIQLADLAGRTAEGANAISFFTEQAGDMPAEKSAGSSDESEGQVLD